MHKEGAKPTDLRASPPSQRKPLLTDLSCRNPPSVATYAGIGGAEILDTMDATTGIVFNLLDDGE